VERLRIFMKYLISAALLLFSPATSLADDVGAAGNAIEEGVSLAKDKAKADVALRRANQDLMQTLNDADIQHKFYVDLRAIEATKALISNWQRYIDSECELVGSSVVSMSPQQSNFVLECATQLIRQRLEVVRNTIKCLHQPLKPDQDWPFASCSMMLTPLAVQGKVEPGP
jgi:hypothetical protein